MTDFTPNVEAFILIKVDPPEQSLARIRNTLELVDIHVSEPLMKEVRANPSQFEVVGQPEALKFDGKGTLYPMLGKHQETVHV